MTSTSTPTRQRIDESNLSSQRTPRPATAGSSSATSSTSGAKGNNSNSSRIAAKDLLRDYYGLSRAGGAVQDEKGTTKSIGVESNPLNIGRCRVPCLFLPVPNRTRVYPDSPSFSAQAYIQDLLDTSTLPQLLKANAEISSSILDLESERQSLVYNHHHELIDASVTISKMKVRAESLDSTLEQLKAGLSRCSELNNGLKLPVNATGVSPDASDDAHGANMPTAREPAKVDWQSVLDTVLDLPFAMRNATPEEAQRLWGTYEPVLRQWKDAGVQGIEEVETECRQCLNGHGQ